MKGIIFSTPMVQAILAGRKTQTRRIIKPQPKNKIDETWSCDTKPKSGFSSESAMRSMLPIYAPYKVGDVLYVKETYAPALGEYAYKADYSDFVLSQPENKGIWKSPMFMPEKAARFFIIITGLKVERLHDISEEDAISEGVEWCYSSEEMINRHSSFCDDVMCFRNYKNNGWEQSMLFKGRQSFQSLWKSIHSEDSWYQNPWVWAYTFKIY